MTHPKKPRPNHLKAAGLRPPPLPHNPACQFDGPSLARRAPYRPSVSLRSDHTRQPCASDHATRVHNVNAVNKVNKVNKVHPCPWSSTRGPKPLTLSRPLIHPSPPPCPNGTPEHRSGRPVPATPPSSSTPENHGKSAPTRLVRTLQTPLHYIH